MRRWIMLLSCIVCVTCTQAQVTGYKAVADAAAFKQQFSKASQATQSIQSDFVQEKNLSMLSDKIVSKGKFWFKKDNKVKMEYTTPSYYLLIMNGKDIKTKDGQKESHASAKGNKMFEQINKLTVDCVQGNVLGNSDFKTNILENAQSYLLELTPVNKTLSQYFKTIHLLVDKKDYSVTTIRMFEAGGDDTSINFVHKQLNVNIPDATFAVK